MHLGRSPQPPPWRSPSPLIRLSATRDPLLPPPHSPPGDRLVLENVPPEGDKDCCCHHFMWWWYWRSQPGCERWRCQITRKAAPPRGVLPLPGRVRKGWKAQSTEEHLRLRMTFRIQAEKSYHPPAGRTERQVFLPSHCLPFWLASSRSTHPPPPYTLLSPLASFTWAHRPISFHKLAVLITLWHPGRLTAVSSACDNLHPFLNAWRTFTQMSLLWNLLGVIPLVHQED